MTSTTIVLDSAIRDHVLLPIVLVIFLVGVLRHYVSIATASSRTTSRNDIARQQLLQRVQRLHTGSGSGYISNTGYAARRRYYVQGGVLEKEAASASGGNSGNPMMAMMSDPSHMTDMMRNQLTTIVPNAVMMGWVNMFCSGFVVARFPFPLTPRFRSMVQRGVDLNSLDTSYVTSLSMYFLILFGLRGLFSLVLGDAQVDDAAAVQRQMGMGMGGMGGGGGDIGGKLRAERDNLAIATQRHVLNQAEDILLAMDPRNNG
eukprot:gb/GECH01013092.1/.p1 GENE.gb/GECH01013092.1/~~gb/GECH01013092.1/.p1  ORF type:complete len:260 (+),score=53.26 gb/GECH01013092.1/:1-780(+)